MTAPAALPRDQMEAFWMPFTANRQFKANPRMLAKAEGMHYWTPDGRQVLDAVAGLWCVNAGHGRKEISEAEDKKAKRSEMIEQYRDAFSNPYVAAGRRLVDDIIEPSETRKVIAQALEYLHTKRELRPGKKHGLMPL